MRASMKPPRDSDIFGTGDCDAPPAPPVGRQHTNLNIPSAALVNTTFGISSANNLCERPSSRPHVHPDRYRRGTEMEYRGKKHFDPQHVNLSDEAKREAGRYGKAHVIPPSQSCPENRLNLFDEKANNYDKNNNNNNNYYYLRNADGQVWRGQEGGRSKTTSTSAQIAEARLRKIATENPRHRGAVEEALKYSGDVAIVSMEERISRKIASEKYAAGSSQRCEIILRESHPNTKEIKPGKEGGGDIYVLGEPNMSMQSKTPFALDNSAPREDTKQFSSRGARHYHNEESASAFASTLAQTSLNNNNNIININDNNSKSAAPPPYRAENVRQLTGTVDLVTNQYPDPPPVGVRGVPNKYPHRRPTTQLESNDCQDEADMRRSRARCHQRTKEEMPKFIFGKEPPQEAPRQTLRGEVEARWKAQDEKTAERRTGRAMARQSHKPTALW